MVRNPPANAGNAELRVRSWGHKDSLEKEMATHSSILAWKNPMDREVWQATVQRVAKSQTRLRDFHWAAIGVLNSLYCCEILSF